MKLRLGFVSNSSSSSFIIENKTKSRLKLGDFIRENSQLIDEFKEYETFNIPGEFFQGHSGKTFNIKTIEDAINIMVVESKEMESNKQISHNGQRNRGLEPGENFIIFGDEQGTLLGEIYDYTLRDGGESRRFKWRFDEALR